MKAAQFLPNDILTFWYDISENDIDDSTTWPPTVSHLEEQKLPAMLSNSSVIF